MYTDEPWKTGTTLIFGTPDTPWIPMGTAVEASSVIPGVFRPVVVDRHNYVETQTCRARPTSIERPPVTETRVLCLGSDRVVAARAGWRRSGGIGF